MFIRWRVGEERERERGEREAVNSFREYGVGVALYLKAFTVSSLALAGMHLAKDHQQLDAYEERRTCTLGRGRERGRGSYE